MIQLVYVSTAASLVSIDEIDAILEASRRNNERSGVTGLLLYNGRRFLQALEGNQDAVERTYSRIKADPRHKSLAIVMSRDVDLRMFGDWSMAARRAATDKDLDDLKAQVDVMTADLAPGLRAHFARYAEMRP